MLEFKKGNLFDSGCEAITNAVNTVGVMGGGIALQFKKRYPDMYLEYAALCQDGKLRPGMMHIWENPKGSPKYIVNFPTKDDLSPSQNHYVTMGLLALAKEIKNRNIKSIAIPALGCGLGNLEYKDVKLFIEAFAKTLPEDVDVVVYEPWE